MRSSVTALPMACLLAVLACSMALAGGCASLAEQGEDERAPSLVGTGREMGRGLTNVALCWLEIPNEVETRIRKNRTGHPFNILANAFHVVFGTLGGAVDTAERACGGAIEIILSPFPPYGPIMEPALPPYLNPEEEQGEGI